jgi:hypothetical protein
MWSVPAGQVVVAAVVAALACGEAAVNSGAMTAAVARADPIAAIFFFTLLYPLS